MGKFEGSMKQKWSVSAWSSTMISVKNAKRNNFECSAKIKVESVFGQSEMLNTVNREIFVI